MAEIIQTNKGGQRSKKLSTRVDLTPMVDLGFLLITFFIFTTTMAESKSMNLIMPTDKSISNPLKHPESKTLTFILDGDNKIFYYSGLFIDQIHLTDFNAGIRNTILLRKSILDNASNSGKDLLVLIKPTLNASYKNIVDVLDEMLINDVKHYMILEPDEQELLILKNISN